MTEIPPPTPDDSQEVRGNEYDSHAHETPGKVGVGTTGSGHAGSGVGVEPGGATSAPGEEIPPEDGARAWVDQRTGAVHGSGMGAGGGQPGEDFGSDAGGDIEEP